MKCELTIKDPILSKALGSPSFIDLESFQKALKRSLLVDKSSIPVSLTFKGAKGVQERLKFLRVFDSEQGLVVEVALPNLETGKNLKKLKASDRTRVEKYSIVIPDIQTELGVASDLDTLTALWLGNYFVPDKESVKNVIEKQLPVILEADFDKVQSSAFLNSVISERGVIDYYLKIASDNKIEIDEKILKSITEKRAVLRLAPPTEVIRADKFKEYSEKDKKENKEEVAPEFQTPKVSSGGMIFKSFNNPVEATQGSHVEVARQMLIRAINNTSGTFRVRAVAASKNFAQPQIEGKAIPLEVVRHGKGLVMIVEQKETVEGVENWKPVFLKKGTKVGLDYLFTSVEITTNPSDALVLEYYVGEEQLFSSQMYLPIPSTKRGEIEAFIDEGYNPSFRIEGGSIDASYGTLAERGVSLDRIRIPAQAEFGDRGIARILGPQGIELLAIGSLEEGDEIYQEVISLLKGEYKSFTEVSRVISYLNQVLMLGEFTTPKSVQSYEETLTREFKITNRSLGFYPYKTATGFGIETSVEKHKVDGKIVTEKDQTPVREVNNKVKSALLTQRINIPKAFESEKLGMYPDRLYFENGIKEKSWPQSEQAKFISSKVKTRLTEINGKIGYARNYIYTHSLDKLSPDFRPETPVTETPVPVVAPVVPLLYSGIVKLGDIKGTFLNEESELILGLLDQDIPLNFVSDEEINKLGEGLIAAYSKGKIYLRASAITEDNVRGFVLEELIHAYTADKLETYAETVEYDILDKLRIHLSKGASDKLAYYTESMEEFVASITMPFMQEAIKNSGFQYDTTDNKSVLDYIMGLVENLVEKIQALFGKENSIEKQATLDSIKLIFGRVTKVKPVVAEPKKRSLSSKKTLLGAYERVKKEPFEKVEGVPVRHLDMLLSNLAWDIGQFAELIGGLLDANLVKAALKEELELEAAASPERAEYLQPFLDNFDGTFSTWLSESSLAKNNKPESSKTSTSQENEKEPSEISEDTSVEALDVDEIKEILSGTGGDKATRFQDRTESTISSVDAGTKQARIFMKMIPKIAIDRSTGNPIMEDGEYVYARDKFGNLIPADYTALWNSVADQVQGSIDVEEMKEKLRGYKKMPEMNIVLNRLERITGEGENAYEEVFILKGIEKSFSKMLVPTVLLSQEIVNKRDTGKYSEGYEGYTEVFPEEFEDYNDYENYDSETSEPVESSRAVKYNIYESGRLDGVNIQNALNDYFRHYAKTNGWIKNETINHVKLLNFLETTLEEGLKGYTEKSIITTMKIFGVHITTEMLDYPDVRAEVISISSAFLSKLKTKLETMKGLTSEEVGISNDVFDFVKKTQQVNKIYYNGFPQILKDFQNTMSKYLPYSTSNMTKNAEGENQSNLHNYSSWLLNIKFINEGKYEKVERLRNPIAKYSLAFNAIKRGAKIYPINISGTKGKIGTKEKGTNSINLPTIEYLRQEFVTLLFGGFKENLRAETASSSFGFKLPYRKGTTPASTYLPLGLKNVREAAIEQHLQYLKGDIKRAWLERNQPTEYGSKFYTNVKSGLTFLNYLNQDFLTDLDLLELRDVDKWVDDNREEFIPQFEARFDALIEDLKLVVETYTGIPFDKNHPMFDSQVKDLVNEDFRGTVESFVLNATVLDIEEIILFHGEVGTFDKIFKRLKSNISNGTPAVMSEVTSNLIRERLKGGTFSDSFGVRPPYYDNPQEMQSIILEESRMSASPEQVENLKGGVKTALELTDAFFGRESSEEKLESRANSVVKPYSKSDVSDGEGFIHPDAYRMLCIAVDSWGPEKEEGFQYLATKYKKEKGFILDEREKALIAAVEERIRKEGYYFQFPKLKLQYRGAARKDGTNVAVEMLDKFALTPMFPDFVKGKIGEQHFEQMSKQGIAYGKFQSGTKLGTFNPDGWEVVKEYESVHTVDTIYMKEQVKTPDYLKTENLMGSQKRKLVLSNLTLNGEFMDSLKKDVGDWVEGQRELATKARTELMNEIGQKIKGGYEIDLKKVVELIKTELQSRDLPKAYTDLFENYHGQNFEESLSPQTVETLVYSLLKNRIVKAKFPGGQLVQVSSAIFGADKLEFYRVKDGKILPADCMVTLAGDFLNLLNLPEVTTGTLEQLNELLKDDNFREKYKDELTISAYRIPTQGFNSKDILMVKEFLPGWMGNTIIPPPQIVTKSGTDYDYDKMSVIFPSIEKNGRYTREPNEVYLTEKYTTFYEAYSKLGNLSPEEKLESLKDVSFNIDLDLLKLVQRRFDKKKKIITKEEFIELAKNRVFKKAKFNKVLDASKNILLNPANFHRLIMPNTDALIIKAVENILKQLYPGVEKVNAEPQLSTITSYATHLRKWYATKMKDLLGIGAVANTFYTLMQTVNFELNDSLTINKVPFSFRVPLLSKSDQQLVNLSNPFIIENGVTDLDKLELINQFINITVDAASNDIAGYTNLNRDNTGFVMFQLMLGVPLDNIFQLIHQPIVYQYHRLMAKHTANGIPKSDASRLIYEELLGISPIIVGESGSYNKSSEQIWKEIAGIGYPDELNTPTVPDLKNMPTKGFNDNDRQNLVYYLVGLAQSEGLRKLQGYNNFDTSTSPSYKLGSLKEDSIIDVEVDGLFSVESARKIHEDSVISHLNVQEEFKIISESIFRIKNASALVEFVTKKGRAVRTDKDKFVRIFDNDFLMYVVQNFGDTDWAKVKEMMFGKLMEDWANLKQKYPELEETTLAKKLVSDSREEGMLNPMLFMGLDSDVETYNTLAQEIDSMSQSLISEVSDFANNLVKVGFLQTGFNQSPLYMLKAFPPHMITALTSEAYKKFKELSKEQRQAEIENFWNMFLKNRVQEFGKFFPEFYNKRLNQFKANFDTRTYRYMPYKSERPKVKEVVKAPEVQVIPSVEIPIQATSTDTVVDKSMAWGELKDLPVYSDKGIMVMRKQNTNKHFGNPFTGSGIKGLILMPNVSSAVLAYKNWLRGYSTTEDTEGKIYNIGEVAPVQKQWILSQIEQGKLDNKTLLYMSDKEDYYSHADALADLVNSKEILRPTAVETVDDYLKTAEEIQSKLTGYTEFEMVKESKKQVINGSDQNDVLFEKDNVEYLMTDEQQIAFNGLVNFLMEKLDNRKDMYLGSKVAFTEDLSKEYSGIFPQDMWDNMVGLIGKGGVGKTTLIRKVLEEVDSRKKAINKYNYVRVAYLGPTHNAVTVLQESLGFDSEDNEGASTIQSLVARNQSASGNVEPGQPVEKLMLLAQDAYTKQLNAGFRQPISGNDIIVVDESSMVSAQVIKDILFRFEVEEGYMPIFIFMGDYRQLPPIEDDSETGFKEGIISATLFNSHKVFTLTQVMRSKDKAMHDIFDSVGDQISTQRVAFNKGERQFTFDNTLYQELTKRSTKDMLVVNSSQVDEVINNYVTLLKSEKNPYNTFWVHYNNVSYSKTIALAEKIRTAYFKKLGTAYNPDKINVGDYIQNTEGFSIKTVPYKDAQGKEYSKGNVKPSARLKVLKIEEKTVFTSELNGDVSKYFGNVEVKVQATIVYNRQGKERVIYTMLGEGIRKGEYHAASARQMLHLTDAKGNVKTAIIPYGVYKELASTFATFSKPLEELFNPAYLGSAQTAQGMGYKRIIVGEYNIRENAPYISLRKFESALYTSLTRVQQKLIIVAPQSSKIENNQEVFEWAETLIEGYNSEEVQTIVTNFATKHKMSNLEASLYINQALESDSASKESVLESLKCYI